MKPKIALVRGKFLNKYDMQSYEPLIKKYALTAFGSQTAIHTQFAFPTVELLSPLDVPDFPYKSQMLNRIFVDAHYLGGLEEALRGFSIAHTAETYFHFTKQCLDAKKKGYVKKVIVTVWENIPFNNEGIRGRSEFKKRVFAEADHFIAVSERAKLALELEGVHEEKITVVHPGIDINEFTKSSRDCRANTRNDISLLFVGRLVKNKGVYELLYSLKSLFLDEKIKNYSLHLTIVGEGSEKQAMKIIGRKLGIESHILFKKLSYEDMQEEYCDADIFIAPSKEDSYWQEQWGMALMEAQASGLPIVTTMSGSIPENVGDAALLVQSGDVLSLSEAIKKFVLDPKLRGQYQQKARKRAETMHDREIAAKNIKNVYEKVLQ